TALPPPRGRGRPPVAVLGRDAPGRALPPQPPLGGTRRRTAGAVQPRRPRPARRQARRRIPDPPDDRPPARLLQHRCPVGRLSLAAPPGRRFGACAPGQCTPTDPP